MILYFLKWAQSLLQPCHNNLLIHYGRCIYSLSKIKMTHLIVWYKIKLRTSMEVAISFCIFVYKSQNGCVFFWPDTVFGIIDSLHDKVWMIQESSSCQEFYFLKNVWFEGKHISVASSLGLLWIGYHVYPHGWRHQHSLACHLWRCFPMPGDYSDSEEADRFLDSVLPTSLPHSLQFLQTCQRNGHGLPLLSGMSHETNW